MAMTACVPSCCVLLLLSMGTLLRGQTVGASSHVISYVSIAPCTPLLMLSFVPLVGMSPSIITGVVVVSRWWLLQRHQMLRDGVRPVKIRIA